MPQLFSNNAGTTLAADLTDSATSLSVASATGFDAITAPDFELVTIEDGALREIVKVTARSGTTWTIARAQEGTTARAWATGSAVESRLTAGTLDGMMQTASHPDVSGLDHGGNARGADAVNLQPGRTDAANVASGAGAVAIGDDASATGSKAVAIGPDSAATADLTLAIGGEAAAGGPNAVGVNGAANAENAIAVGVCWAEAVDSVTVGTYAYNEGVAAVCLGPSAWIAEDAANAVAIGNMAIAEEPYTLHIPALWRHAHFDAGSGAGPTDRDGRTAHMCAPVLTLMSEPLDLSDNTATLTLVIPPNTRFCIDTAGAIITSADTPVGTPAISVTGALTTESVTAATAWARQLWKDIDGAGITGTITIACTTAITSGELFARVYVSGIMIADPA